MTCTCSCPSIAASCWLDMGIYAYLRMRVHVHVFDARAATATVHVHSDMSDMMMAAAMTIIDENDGWHENGSGDISIRHRIELGSILDPSSFTFHPLLHQPWELTMGMVVPHSQTAKMASLRLCWCPFVCTADCNINDMSTPCPLSLVHCPCPSRSPTSTGRHHPCPLQSLRHCQ